MNPVKGGDTLRQTLFMNGGLQKQRCKKIDTFITRQYYKTT